MQNIAAPAPREPQEGWGCEGTRTRTGELAGGGGGGGSGEVGALSWQRGPRENRSAKRKSGRGVKELEEEEEVGEAGGHQGSAGRSQSALCKQASSWSGQVAGGGVVGSPPRATGAVSRADN